MSSFNASLSIEEYSGARNFQVLISTGVVFQTFDARTVTDETVNALKPILSMEYFTYETMSKISSAAANLANWVIKYASVSYHLCFSL